MISFPHPTLAGTALCALLAGGTFGCGGGDGAEAARTAAEEMTDAIAQMAGGGGEPVEPVDYQELKDLLPEQVIGWSRVSHEGEKSAAGAMSVSTASALYQSEDRQFTTIQIELIDTGGMGSLAAMGMAHWLRMDLNREDDNGYERTTRYDDYPAYETFVRKDGEIGSANLSIVVGERFIVQVRGADVSMADVMSATGELDLDRLADLAKE